MYFIIIIELNLATYFLSTLSLIMEGRYLPATYSICMYSIPDYNCRSMVLEMIDIAIQCRLQEPWAHMGITIFNHYTKRH